MARLQDYPSVTPTSSDKILIVQSQGQGLAPHTIKLDSANPTGTGYVSMNRTGSVGQNSVAVNTNCTASGAHSHAEGYQTTASGNYSHTEGSSTTANKSGAHAEGSGTTASGDYSHAEGQNTTASGNVSHAEGYGSTASGIRSHAEGSGTIASHEAQHVFGEYNVSDPSTAASTSRGTYIEIVGKGASANARSNARTLDWSGNEVLAGDLTIMGNKSVNDAITVQNVSITVDTTKITSGTITCKKINHVAFVSFYGVIFATSGNNQTNLVTGLPKALMQPTITSFGGDDAAHTKLINTNGDTIWIDTNGTALKGHISAETYNQRHYVLFSYPCE